MKISNMVSITSCANAIPLHTFLSIRYAMETALIVPVEFLKIPPAIADDVSDSPSSTVTLANHVLPFGEDIFQIPEQYSDLTMNQETTVAATTTTEWTTHPYVEWTTTTLDFDHSTESGWSTSEPEWMSRHISIYGADAPTPYRPNEKMFKQRAAKATESTPTQSTPFVISSPCNIL